MKHNTETSFAMVTHYCYYVHH